MAGVYHTTGAFNVHVEDSYIATTLIDPYGSAKVAASTSRLLSSAATTNATSVKAAAGTLYHISGFNASGSRKFLKIYNKASAPTVGTDTPTLTFNLESNQHFRFSWTEGRIFSTGIAFALTGAAADADTTALASGDVICLNVEYT